MRTKPYIILLVILLIFSLVMILLFGIRKDEKKTNDKVLIIGNHSVLKKANNKWYKITSSDEIKNLNWRKYQVFSNYENIGQYNLWYDNKWYIFDNNKKAIESDGEIFAYPIDFDITLYPYTEENNQNNDIYVNKVLDDNNIKEKKYSVNYKAYFDYDNDGENEYFYVVSNTFSNDYDPSIIYSFVFMVKDDNIYPIYQQIQKNNSMNSCRPYFSAFLDTNNDNRAEVLLSCSEYSNGVVEDMLFEFQNREFKNLILN